MLQVANLTLGIVRLMPCRRVERGSAGIIPRNEFRCAKEREQLASNSDACARAADRRYGRSLPALFILDQISDQSTAVLPGAAVERQIVERSQKRQIALCDIVNRVGCRSK